MQSTFEKRHDLACNGLDVSSTHVLIHRQRQDSLRLPLGGGEIALLVSEFTGCRLEMNWDRIVDGRLDAALPKIPLQFIAAIDLHHEGMKSVEFLVPARRHIEPLV